MRDALRWLSNTLAVGAVVVGAWAVWTYFHDPRKAER